jgi:hypothetical protein
MHSDFVLIDRQNGTSSRVDRLAFGDTSGRNEAWLRDTLLANPELLPIHDLDPSYGPLVPLCRELRTTAGPIDAAFISPLGRLTLVECKLWRNPEARRKVIAQTLDYARVISRWSYSDLQRGISIATGKHGNVPFELARERHPDLHEQQFVDHASAALRQGRFQLVIAGDGIRDDVSAMAELITRNATLAFSFGLVELALYGMEDGALLVQPRVVARTEIIQRSVIVVQRQGTSELQVLDADEPLTIVAGSDANESLGESPKQAAYRMWWQPVIDAPLDDPDQEPPKLYWPNNVRLPLPWKDTWILAYMSGKSSRIAVTTSGRSGADQEMLRALEPFMPEVLRELPPGTEFGSSEGAAGRTLASRRDGASFPSDDERRAWLIETINSYVNALRPRLKRLIQN